MVQKRKQKIAITGKLFIVVFFDVDKMVMGYELQVYGLMLDTLSLLIMEKLN